MLESNKAEDGCMKEDSHGEHEECLDDHENMQDMDILDRNILDDDDKMEESAAADSGLKESSSVEGDDQKKSSEEEDEKAESKDEKAAGGGAAASSRNLWVSGLTDLKTLFSKYGKVVGAKVVTNAKSPGARHCGFVTMSSTSTEDISQLHRTQRHRKMISVERGSALTVFTAVLLS
ncbi:scaffold attachment factor B2 [Oryzias melastigma]|uniref:scaffold attachment factor B2 n=1 Tax=Oryzias melastigma TaxID=30732 RepID=UPI000CF81685|nr:scaffold attachment factor B2 [Oryzias melastigma]XP_024118826.1 scaffold attachment factor B2 [Oryzias melastigma]